MKGNARSAYSTHSSEIRRKHMKTGNRKSLILVILVLLMVVAAITPVNAREFRGRATVAPVDSVVYGRTYGDWAAAWHQWSDAMKADKHPLFDTASCSEGQSGPVWFLGGRMCGTEQPECDNSLVERECTVPAGKALFFPIVNIACLDKEAENNYCMGAGPVINEMRATIAGIIDKVSGLELEVDGRPARVDLKEDFRVQSPVYTTVVPDGNSYQAISEPEIVAGSYLAVDDGIYVMLEPLRKGKHTLNFKGAFPDFGFSLDVTYELTVK
jgi:hypothetical protein